MYLATTSLRILNACNPLVVVSLLSPPLPSPPPSRPPQSVSTYGFRGEALSSLAALSALAVVTRTPQQAAGVRLEYDKEVCGCVCVWKHQNESYVCVRVRVS